MITNLLVASMEFCSVIICRPVSVDAVIVRVCMDLIKNWNRRFRVSIFIA
jgi:hypothetical protein